MKVNHLTRIATAVKKPLWISWKLQPWVSPTGFLPEVILLGLFTLALVLPFFLNPDPQWTGTHRQLFLPPCPFLQITGIPCPLCGATTSFTYLTRGDLAAAFGANPLAPIYYLILLAAVFMILWALVHRKNIHLSFHMKGKTLCIIIVAIWTLKLISWYGLLR
jgi:hypothetical protein